MKFDIWEQSKNSRYVIALTKDVFQPASRLQFKLPALAIVKSEPNVATIDNPQRQYPLLVGTYGATK